MPVAVARGAASGLPRLAAALAAVALAAAASLALAALLAPATAPPARNPFGTGLREAAPAASGLGAVLLGWQSAFFGALREALAAIRRDGSALPVLLLVGFTYGVCHAAGPGHGKAVISAYIVSGGRGLARGLGLSAAAAAIQAVVAVGLVLAVFAVAGGTAAAMGQTVRVVEIAGFGLLAALGALLVWQKAGRVAALAGGRPGAVAAGPCCAEPHGPPPDRASGGQLALVALGAGIRPCAGALVVLTLALGQGLLPAGIAAVFAMAAGTALTTGALAALAVYAKRAALALAGGRGRGAALAAAALELGAAAFVLVLGAGLLAGLLAGEGG